jgi:hypothetical protein
MPGGHEFPQAKSPVLGCPRHVGPKDHLDEPNPLRDCEIGGGGAAHDCIEGRTSMASQSASHQGMYRAAQGASPRSVVTATAITLFAAVFMVVGGAFHVIQGLAALINEDFFVAVNGYAYDVDITAWGWLHVIVGGIVALTGLALLSGALWARLFAIFIVVVSGIVNFIFIPYQPLWSIVLLAADGVVLWALLMFPELDESPDLS